MRYQNGLLASKVGLGKLSIAARSSLDLVSLVTLKLLE